MFAVHKTLLQLCKHRQLYEEYHEQLPQKGLDAVTRLYIELYGKYFKRFDGDTVQLDSLLTLMAQLEYKQEDIDRVNVTWENIKEEPEENSAKGITKGLAELKAADSLGKILIKYEEGQDIDLYEACSGIVDTLGKQSSLDISPAEDSWKAIEEALYSSGKQVTFPLKCLNNSMVDVTTGTQIIVAARPDVGKTSFCANLAVHFAKIAPDNRPILILNNEGTKYRWLETCYRNALGKTTDQIRSMDDLKREAEYSKIGIKDRLVIIDSHGFNLHRCESIIQQHKPYVVFWDMLDHFRGFDDKSRDDLILEAKYQYTRELSVRYDFLSVPTSQLKLAAEGVAFPPLGSLAGSGVGKQGACEAVLLIGHNLEQGKERERYIGLPKNKFNHKTTARKDCGQTTVFQWEIARFKEA